MSGVSAPHLNVSITSKDGQNFGAYLTKPATLPAPAIIIIQEIFGVNDVMREIADDFAAKGYLAICPDIFWRQEPGIQLTDKTEEEWQRAFDLYNGFDEAAGVDDLIATLDFINAHEDCSGKTGSIGFCLGGKLAYLMSTRSSANCSVSFYGVGIDSALDEASNISAPLLMHIAEEDKFVDKEAQHKINDALADNSRIEIHNYSGVDHAFARIGGEHYDETAAGIAWQRSDDFLKKYLG